MPPPLDVWARNLKLNPNSETTRQLFENRALTVAAYVSRFRRGRLREVIPTDALNLTVEEALGKRKVSGVNLRKLLASRHEKFRK